MDKALAKKGESLKSLERWKEEMPTEAEMAPRDKYTIFARYEKKYRKGIHSTRPFILFYFARNFELLGRSLGAACLGKR